MVFAQQKADGKGQELSAIDKLLDLLELKGSVITIDALGCQKKIVLTSVSFFVIAIVYTYACGRL